ncbi:unnamed protein product [Cylicocyclus nassatus]|uniref:Uncharacterized protein n=1 Tax=Cylicocyclus nassatus TaxID=53992 RepID=A0AA36GM09_CYLNA|nr:unnamed protein product [Cylicocyclus nassatus]
MSTLKADGLVDKLRVGNVLASSNCLSSLSTKIWSASLLSLMSSIPPLIRSAAL